MSARLVLFLLVGFTLVPSATAQPALRWQFKTGDVFFNEVRQNTQTIITVRDQVQPQELKQTVLCRYTVKDVRADGTVVLERRVENVTFENDKGLPDVERIAKLMKGMTFSLTLDPRKHQIIKLEGYDDFIGRLAQLDEDAAKAMRAMLPVEAISASIEADFFHTPDQAVKKGDGWTRRFRMPMGPLGNLTGQNTYTYADETFTDPKDEDAKQPRQRFTFSTAAKLEPPSADQATPGGLQFSNANLKIEEARGTVLFDASKGRVVKAATTMKFTVTLTAEANGQPLNMVLSQTTTQTSRFLDRNPLVQK